MLLVLLVLLATENQCVSGSTIYLLVVLPVAAVAAEAPHGYAEAPHRNAEAPQGNAEAPHGNAEACQPVAPLVVAMQPRCYRQNSWLSEC